MPLALFFGIPGICVPGNEPTAFGVAAVFSQVVGTTPVALMGWQKIVDVSSLNRTVPLADRFRCSVACQLSSASMPVDFALPAFTIEVMPAWPCTEVCASFHLS